ncbi:MAG: mechanosensitive ion channel family protein [Acidobacteria bacterium]|nr:mechanosensitive ion channel family protein [Acidobacteriota bacterium]MCI0568458.1 mechanosensitive ion channel family protein [Acidobacteriota bacterium]
MNPQTEVFRFFRPGGVPYALVILLVTFVAARLLTASLSRLGRRFPDKRLPINQAGSFLRFSIYLLGGAGAAASVLIMTQEMLLAVGGTLAVSIGFALKDLVASVVAGMIILVDKPFQVGDRVTFGEYYGEIRDIGLRSVRLVTLEGAQVTIPNNKFLTEVVTSRNSGAVEMMVQMDFFVALDHDVARAKRIVEEALTTSRYVNLKLRWVVNVSEVSEAEHFAARLRAKAYVLDVRFERAFETDVSERVIAKFRESGIYPPASSSKEI